MVGVPEYALERFYDAAPELLWRAWTDPSLFSRWYAPGLQTIVHKMEVHLRGESRIQLKWDNNSLYQKFLYLEVDPYQRLTWLLSPTNESWEPISSPVAQNWPAKFLTTIKLEPSHEQISLHLSLTPVDATDEETMAFRKARMNIDAGWNAGMKVLDEVVDELKKEKAR